MSLVGEKISAVDSQLRATHSSLREKDIMERRAVSRLQRSPYPEVRRVVCEFHEGLLRLRGRVSSFYLKQMAQTVVLEMEGVEEIHNHLEVVAPADCPFP